MFTFDSLFLEIPVTVNHQINVVTAGGVQMEGIVLTSIQHQLSSDKVISEEIKVVPNIDETTLNLREIFKIILQLLAENPSQANLIRLVNDESADVIKIKEAFQTILEDTPETSNYKIDVVPSSCVSTNGSKSKDAALLVLRDIIKCNKNDLSNLIVEGSFLLTFIEPSNEKVVLKAADSAGLGLVLKKLASSDRVAILFRKKRIIKKTSVLEINNDQDWTSQIREKINSKDCERLILFIRTDNCATLCENLQVLRKELNGKKIRIVDIQDPKAPELFLEDPFYQDQINLDLNLNVLLPGKVWGTYRRFSITSKLHQVNNWKASQLNTYDLDTISWVEGPSHEADKTVRVEYSAINQPDILIATGKATTEYYGKDRLQTQSFGLEYSGVDAKGNRLMGISASGTLSNSTLPDSDYTWSVPDNWSLEDASTVPLAYTVAYMALHIKGNIQNKESVLVYDSGCAFGQAAINLALRKECEVFTTYANENQKKFLKNGYPNISESHLISSTTKFADKILKTTKGKGVDVIIYNGNDLRNIEYCMSCVENNARVVILGDLQGALSKSVGMGIFLRQVALLAVIPQKVIDAEPSTRRTLAQLVKNGVASGVVKPLFRNVYSREMLKNAFIDEALKKNCGKVRNFEIILKKQL